MIKTLINYNKCFGFKSFYLLIKNRFFKSLNLCKVNNSNIKTDLYLRFGTSDIDTYLQVFISEEYNYDYGNPIVIVDAGANIGLTSIYFANKYPNATIIAIEPEESNYKLMLKNISSYDNIIPLNAAIWFKNEDLSVIDPGSGFWGYQVSKFTEECNTNLKSPGITIDTLMTKYSIDLIDLLKMDIEGAGKKYIQKLS